MVWAWMISRSVSSDRKVEGEVVTEGENGVMLKRTAREYGGLLGNGYEA